MIYLLPFIAAAVGWFTNYLAVKMLFRPKHPKKILFFTIQGIFPKNQEVVAERIGTMVASELLSSQDIQDKLMHPENLESLKGAIGEKIDEYLNVTFPKNYPLTSVFFGSKRKAKVKDDLMVEIEHAAPDVVDKYIADLEHTLNVEAIISEKVRHLEPDKLENIIMSILKKEFQFIEWIGALIGFLIGLIQLVIVLV